MKFTDMVEKIATVHKESIIKWKQSGLHLREEGLLRLVEENHAFNYQLWHAEDRARRDDKGYEFVYRAKREIDHYNQQRNNRMEDIDLWFYNSLEPASSSTCTVHSETPGMMIDRLSILALKSYHMKLQTERTDVSQDHLNTCEAKLNTIEEQLRQLQACLLGLLEEISNKSRTFRIYRQFKMYNDPSLNPELY
ncbi:DUF4254 domain-containing protein [Legionella londiniensis]|uniref:DUF4254 domain-containing protein n=1 Tax=Legionella londiniensis TaxID=45068 RepID=A0A0W0VNP3_9GAMM|nr:DUF4254 domain-containing protein [Legionella londiniensis]KTD21794.1 hypothetical protein Llon_0959 [Legionella londiniensis]STX92170.1 Uncharacterised protein [Legionella londiniensis]